MISYVQPQLMKFATGVGTDRIIGALSVPPGGIFGNVTVDLRLHAAEQLAATALIYGISAYAIPIPDPDAAQGYDAIWDTNVPKMDNNSLVLDLDAASSDTTPDIEPGEVDWNEVYKFTSAPERLYRSTHILSIADGAPGPMATGGATHWFPRARHRFTLKGGGQAQLPTAVMIALSIPNLDRTIATIAASPTEDEWLLLQLLRDTALDALKHLIGRTEAGAETPYIEAATFLAKLLAPDIHEETAGQFGAVSLEVLCKTKWNMAVPGTLEVGKLDAGGF